MYYNQESNKSVRHSFSSSITTSHPETTPTDAIIAAANRITETRMAYRQEIMETGMTFQLVPPDDHRRNIAKKIQTWKDHFISVCRGVSAHFPMHLWCKLIQQSEKQLPLIRQRNINPKISAFAYLYGPHDYNAQPFVSIGMESMIHDKPSRIKTFAQQCSKGFVLGSSPEHY